MTTYLLILVYGLIIIAWMLRSPYFRLKGLPYGTAALLFVVKTIMAWLYYWVYQHYYEGGDVMLYLRDGQIVYETLYTDPKAFLMLCFGPSDLQQVPELIATQVDAMGYWHDTGHYMVVRSIALMNLLSFGSALVNYMFMGLLSTLGLVFIYKAISKHVQPNRMLQIALFGIPSILFWTSGLHKEGLVLFFAGALVTDGTKLLKGDIKPLWIFGAVMGFVLLYLVRDFVALLMIPALISLLIASRVSKYTWVIYLAVYAMTIVAGTAIPLGDGGNYLDLILTKQDQFKALQGGNTQLPVHMLQPTIGSLLAHLPEAFYRAMFSPVELIQGTWPHIVSALEGILLVALLLFGFIKNQWSKTLKDPYAMAFLALGITLLLLIGYIVPNIGAIVRYRSIALLFLFVGILMHLRPRTV